MLLNLHGSGPLYRRIYHALKADICAGRLGPRARLPSTRALASDLGVSRNTVLLAYEQLIAEGYILSRHRSPTIVATLAPASTASLRTSDVVSSMPRLSEYGKRITADPAMPPSGSYAPRSRLRHDFRYGRPALDAFPHRFWRRLLAAHARESAPEKFGYAAPQGCPPLREALVGYLHRARGIRCSADQILIVNGTQQGLELAARVLIDRGDRVVIEEPHYHSVRLTFDAAGARLHHIEVDHEGLDTRKLPRQGVRLACVTPCHQFPTGVVMPLSRRVELLEWATRTNAYVLEDDYVSEFRYDGHPIEALQALDRNDRVIYVGSFSKTLFPALRIAYLVLPRPLVHAFTVAKWMADRYTAPFVQEVLAEFIDGGNFERYLRRVSTGNAGRRRTLIEALRKHFGDRVEFAGENAGVHLLVWLRDKSAGEVEALVERAAEAGVGIYPINLYYTRHPQRAGLLFGYASLTEAEIRAGVRRLASVI